MFSCLVFFRGGHYTGLPALHPGAGHGRHDPGGAGAHDGRERRECASAFLDSHHPMGWRLASQVSVSTMSDDVLGLPSRMGCRETG